MAFDPGFAVFIFTYTMIGLLYIWFFCCSFCRQRTDLVDNPHEDGQHPHRRPPSAQSVPLQPDPSRPVRAQDLQTRLYHTSTAPKVSRLEFAYTPQRCRQYLSERVNVLVTHSQYKLAVLYSYTSSIRSGSDALCNECMICLSEFEDEDACFVVGRCTHVFHKHCAYSWLSSNYVCPVCRSVVIHVLYTFIP